MSNKDWFDDQISGAAALAILIGAVAALVGVLPAVVLRERFQHAPAEPDSTMTLRANVLDFLQGFKTTISSKPFLKLCAATFLVFNGFILI
ncbi:MFS transporter, partial [Myxococcota bacterium]|nr:MFS transporter [Myxococcota bacterium]